VSVGSYGWDEHVTATPGSADNDRTMQHQQRYTARAPGLIGQQRYGNAYSGGTGNEAENSSAVSGW
jgi:hypothetical protein